MGDRGPAKKPTALIKLNNNAGCHAKGPLENEPTPETVIPLQPVGLGTIALREWKRITKQLEKQNLVSELDAQLLKAYCRNVQLAETMWKVIKNSEVRFCAICDSMLNHRNFCKECESIVDVGSTIKGEEAYFLGRTSQRCMEFKAMNTATENIIKIAAKFGMSPSDRSRMHVPVPEKESKLAGMMKDAN